MTINPQGTLGEEWGFQESDNAVYAPLTLMRASADSFN